MRYISIVRFGDTTITENENFLAYKYAKANQGFRGDYAAWCALSQEERDEYEKGAAGYGH